MSNVTYLPWVSPDPDDSSDDMMARSDAASEGIDIADALIHDDELAKLDALVIRKLTSGDLSSGEVRVLLLSQGLPELDADRWLARYERLGYVNDERLAHLLITQWGERKGKGRGLIAAELRRRHISPQISAQLLAALDDESQEDSATQLAISRARQLTKLDRATAERRLVAFLTRRGFGGSVVRAAVRVALDSSRNAG